MGSSNKKKDCWRYFESKGILWKWQWRFAIQETSQEYVSRVETIWESLWLPVFNVPQFIAKLVIPPNYRLHRRWQLNEGSLYSGMVHNFGLFTLLELMYYIYFINTVIKSFILTVKIYCNTTLKQKHPFKYKNGQACKDVQ